MAWARTWMNNLPCRITAHSTTQPFRLSISDIFTQKKKSPIDAYVIFGIWIHVQKALFALCHLKYGLWTTRFEATNRRGNTAQSGRRIHLVTRTNYCQKCSAPFRSRFGAIITIVGSWQCVHLKDQVLSFKMNGHLWKSVKNWLQKWVKSNVISISLSDFVTPDEEMKRI